MKATSVNGEATLTRRGVGLAFFVCVQMVGALIAATAAGASVPANPPKLVWEKPPVYPKGALARGIEGSVDIAFDVDGKGNVVAPHIVEATPEGVFDAAAIEALTHWKYEARGAPTSGMVVKVQFKQR